MSTPTRISASIYCDFNDRPQATSSTLFTLTVGYNPSASKMRSTVFATQSSRGMKPPRFQAITAKT